MLEKTRNLQTRQQRVKVKGVSSRGRDQNEDSLGSTPVRIGMETKTNRGGDSQKIHLILLYPLFH